MDKSIYNVSSFAIQTEDESMKPVSLLNAVKEAKELVSYELKNKNIEILIREQPGLPQVLASPINVQQVFVTLIRSFWENFNLYDIEGIEKEKWHKKLHIDLMNIENKWILVKLEDNLNLEQQKDLYLKDNKSSIGGMNLHLATAKLIVHSLGGDLRSQRLPTGGLRYKIRIPVDQKEERDELYNLIEMLQE
jgi:C4-dicarboxylate-specific signal transduction histidine kinase